MLLQTFAIFCGLGVHNCQLHENIIKLNARHRVTTEVLAYHAVATAEESSKLAVRSLLCPGRLRLFRYFIDMPSEECWSILQLVNWKKNITDFK